VGHPALARKSILRDAKFPPTAIAIRYEEARAAVVARLAGVENALDNAVAKLRRKSETAITDYWRKNCDLCIDAIESFRGGIACLGPGKTKFRKPDLHNTKLKISEVNVSVSIDLMTEETDRNGKRSIGAAILVFSRSVNNQKEMERRCKTIALLIFQLLKSQANTSPLVDASLCIGVDVFNAKIYRAITPQVRLLRTVETSCEEVANLWPSIKPPVNYKGPPILKIA